MPVAGGPQSSRSSGHVRSHHLSRPSGNAHPASRPCHSPAILTTETQLPAISPWVTPRDCGVGHNWPACSGMQHRRALHGILNNQHRRLLAVQASPHQRLSFQPTRLALLLVFGRFSPLVALELVPLSDKQPSFHAIPSQPHLESTAVALSCALGQKTNHANPDGLPPTLLLFPAPESSFRSSQPASPDHFTVPPWYRSFS